MIQLTGDESCRSQLDLLDAVDFGDDVRYPEDIAQPLRNVYRASRVSELIRKRAAEGNELDEPLEQVVRDLLTDLVHLANLMGDNTFENLADRALSMADMEQSE